jgi:hypothetical protein
VTRGQGAVLIVRARWSDHFTYSSTPYFTDVPPSHSFFSFVQKLKDLGITQGCTASKYCESAPMTRGQAAVFVIKAFFTP